MWTNLVKLVTTTWAILKQYLGNTCTTKISHHFTSWEIIDIAGILVPQKYLTNFVRYLWHSRDNCITKISHKLTLWDITDIAGILVPQKISYQLLREISLIDNHYPWLSLLIIANHWLILAYLAHLVPCPAKNRCKRGAKGVSDMWVPKALLRAKTNQDVWPKSCHFCPIIGTFGRILPLLVHLVPCWLVCCWLLPA